MNPVSKEQLPVGPESVKYTGLFVDSPEKLLQKFPARHEVVVAHHSTNWYKPTSLSELEIGKKSSLKIIGQAADAKCFALLVENLKSKNQYPHITISHAVDVSAVYANELLEKSAKGDTLEMFPEPVFIDVTEGYVGADEQLVA